MITLKEYLDYNDRYPMSSEETEACHEYNKNLINKYPFIKKYNYDWTYADDIPYGWRIAFQDNLLKDIKDVLVKHNCLDKYSILQVKEKWGYLHWYDLQPEEVGDDLDNVIRKYEDLSMEVCQICGKRSEVVTNGWISYLCENCAKTRWKGDYKFLERDRESNV